MKRNYANLNECWAALIVEELVRCGARHFCLAPGSRSSPLAVAVARQQRISRHVHFDERGAAFHAVGAARATGRPAVVITTSGSAAANLWPAVVEAANARLPLILLTADRPPELRDTGANQTIDQVKMFGDYVRWFVDVPCSDRRILPGAVLSAVDQAVHRSLRAPSGPVHMNCMFREPLAPLPDGENVRKYLGPVARWVNGREPWTKYSLALSQPDESSLADASAILRRAKRGIALAGPLLSRSATAAVLKLAEALRWPVLPDVQSGLRMLSRKECVVNHADLILLSERFAARHRADVVLHAGGRPTSKRVLDFISRRPPSHYIHIDDHPFRSDPGHQVTMRIEGDIAAICSRIRSLTKSRLNAKWASGWTAADQRVSSVLDAFELESTDLNEPLVARLVSRHTPRNGALFVGSSMPVRDMDMFAVADGRPLEVVANRGASGIDGNVATACGYSTGAARPVTVVLGDLAMLHDLNSLALVKSSEHPVILVVINNNGGGIFSFLPISQFREVFEPYFGTPQNVSFEHAARLFDLEYAAPDTKASFVSAYARACRRGVSALIEIRTNRTENVAVHGRLQRRVVSALDARRRR